jgi:hypothetical protein
VAIGAAPPQGYSATAGVLGSQVRDATGQVVFDLASQAAAGATALLLTGTGQTTVARFPAAYTCRVVVLAAVTVAVATTTVTLQATWQDPVDGAQTYTWENATSLPVGVRLELPLLCTVQGGQALTVLATAGTPNQVYVTAQVLRTQDG